MQKMANLNFQQPPRSTSSQTLSRNSFNSTSHSGHVTPTSSSLFQISNSNTISFSNLSTDNATTSITFSPPLSNQQSSPGRNIPQIVPNRNNGIFNQQQQRTLSEKRAVGPVLPDWNNVMTMGNSFGHGRNVYGSQNSVNSLHSVFGNNMTVNGPSQSPPLLDLAEFPSLTNRGHHHDGLAHSSSISSKQAYVGMVKTPAEPTEFTMSNEDFPALPGTENAAESAENTVGGGKLTNHELHSSSHSLSDISGNLSRPIDKANQVANLNQNLDSSKKGIQTFPDGKVTNIPPSMVKDQFGMVGLLAFIRAAESDPGLVSLALGQDLTTLGLDLNSAENLYPVFAGPWAEGPCRTMDLDWNVPSEYRVNHLIRDKLPQVKLTKYRDEVLFYLFYSYSGDVLQMAAAHELYNRDWRFLTTEKVWIMQAPGFGLIEKFQNYEKGTYFFFDTIGWRKTTKELRVEYNKLEPRPPLPNAGYQYL